MADENTEVVRKIYASSAVHDIQASLRYIDPEIEVVESPGMAGAQTFVGHDGMRQSIEKFLEAWSEWHMEPTELIPHDDRVLAVVRYTLRGRTSDIEIQDEVGHLWQLRDGRAVRIEVVPNLAKARAAIAQDA